MNLFSEGNSYCNKPQPSRGGSGTREYPSQYSDWQEEDDGAAQFNSVALVQTENGRKWVGTNSPVRRPEHDLSEHQSAASHSIVQEVLHGDARFLALLGYGGTGKTTTAAHMSYLLRSSGLVCVGGAPTHKAAGVLAEKTGLFCLTLHKILGATIKRDFGDDEEEEDAPAQNRGNPGLYRLIDVVFIDEASMIPPHMLDDLKIAADAYGFVVVFIGDPAQLAPIGHKAPDFQNRVRYSEKLTEIVRQEGDNPLPHVAHRYRDSEQPFVPIRETTKNDRKQGVFYVPGRHRVRSAYIRKWEEDGEFVDGRRIYLAPSNKEADGVNTACRKRMLGEAVAKSPFVPGEPFRVFQTLYVNYEPVLLNSELVTLVSYDGLSEFDAEYITQHGSTRKLKAELHSVVVCTESGEHIPCDVTFPKHKQREELIKPLRDAAFGLNKILEKELEIRGLLTTWRSIKRDLRRIGEEASIPRAFEQFCIDNNCVPLKVNTPVYERLEIVTLPELDAVRCAAYAKYFHAQDTIADLRPPYASTVHKAQGSTYETVYMSQGDLRPVDPDSDMPGKTDSDCNRLLYTGITRASSVAIITD